MIGFLRGRLAAIGPTEVLIDVGGVGYRIAMPVRSVAEMPGVGEEVVVHTHLHVREDALALFGFASREDRELFEQLIGANGIGPRLALTILSVFRPHELRQAVTAADRDALCLVPGIGPKSATKLLVELRDRLGAVGEIDLDTGLPGPLAEVRSALEGLGYGSDEVRGVLVGLPAEGETGDLIRAALRALGER